MRYVRALRSKNGMTLVEIIISIVLIFIMVLVVTTIVGSVKERTVSGENRLEANKLAMYTIEKLLSLEYTALISTDVHLVQNTLSNPEYDNTDFPGFLPTGSLNGCDISYTVTDGFWDTSTPAGPYKRIVVTVNWTGVTRPESVSFYVIRGQE